MESDSRCGIDNSGGLYVSSYYILLYLYFSALFVNSLNTTISELSSVVCQNSHISTHYLEVHLLSITLILSSHFRISHWSRMEANTGLQ